MIHVGKYSSPNGVLINSAAAWIHGSRSGIRPWRAQRPETIVFVLWFWGYGLINVEEVSRCCCFRRFGAEGFMDFFWRKRLEIRKKTLEMGSSYPILIYGYLSFVSQLVEREFLKSTAPSWWNNSYKGLKLAFDRCNQEKPAFFGTLLDKLKALDPRLAGCKQL